MFLSTMDPVITDNSTLLDRLGLGAETLLIGMVTVFLMLFVIFLALTVMQSFFTRKKKPAAPSAAAPEAPAPVPAPAAVTEQAPADDKALVAAITAAIAAYTGASPASFRVVAFKKRI